VTVAAFADARKRLNESPLAPPRSPVPRSDDRRHRQGAGLRSADGQFAGCGFRSRFRAGNPVGGGGSAQCIYRDSPRKSWSGPRRWSDWAAQRQVHHRPRPSCAEAQPDAAEWCAPRPDGYRRVTALLIVMKGLPLAYQKDMQRQGAQWRRFRAFTGDPRDDGNGLGLVPDEARMRQAAGDGLCHRHRSRRLVGRTLKMPFRDATMSRANRRQGVEQAGAARTAARSHAGGRAQDHRRRVRVFPWSLGQEPDSFWRTAPKNVACRRRLGEAFSKTAKLLRRNSLQYVVFRHSQSRHSCMVRADWTLS